MSILKPAAALVLAVLALAVMQRTAPGYADITRPITVSGKLGERLSGRQFDIRVESVRLGRNLVYEAYGRRQTLTTNGVWALLEVSAEATTESVSIIAASWQAPNGARYAASKRPSTYPGMLSLRRLEPGLPKRGFILFELPRDQLAGGTVLIARTEFAPLDTEFAFHMDGIDTLPLQGELVLTADD
jgi:hypothetical protein